MINAKRANALLGIGNLLLVIGIAVFAIQFLVIPRPPSAAVEPPRPVPANGPVERVDSAELASLPNPLSTPDMRPRSETVLLIGIDSAGTAYLFVPDRKLYVNAYLEEPILEISGWRLKSITSKGAVFSTPQGDTTLHLAQGPALLAIATPPDEARTALDIAVELFKDGRVEDACVMFEEALREPPSSDAVYAFMQRAGEDVIALILNSKDRNIRVIGYRLFELAKPGGERSRDSNA